MFKSFPDFFSPHEFYSKEKFFEVYDQVTTRVFEFNQGDTCLIPFIDFFNHSDRGVYDFVISKQQDETLKEDFEVIEKRRQMYLVTYRSEIPSDEKIVERIRTNFYGETVRDGAKKEAKQRVRSMFEKL